MKRLLFFVLAVLAAIPFGFPQNRVTITENFDRASHSFTVSPATHWRNDTLLSVSGKKSVWGLVPNSEGDSIELVSPIYDLSDYAYAYLRFTHICKVSDSDYATVEYREDFVGSPWKPLPKDGYKGASLNYRRSSSFHHGSYAVWKEGDLMAQPDNSWWKTEAFDISSEVSYAQVQFKFKIKKGSTVGTNFAWGWFIDNFELTCAVSPISPPVVQFMPPYIEGTIYTTGPFNVLCKAAKRTVLPIETPVMHVTCTPLNGPQTKDSMLMQPYSGDSIWQAVIPAQMIGTQVSYAVYAKDTAGNNASASSGFVIGREWGFDSNSAALLSLDTPVRGSLVGQRNSVWVTLQNRGLSPLTSVTMYWSVNGVQQTPYNWSGSLQEGFTQSVCVGGYVARNGYDTVVVWISLPNGQANGSRDTLVKKTIYGCQQIFNGRYTVGANGQFKSIGSALSALNLCGMSGNVTLVIEKGEYAESVDFMDYMDIIGAKDTLTLVSATGKAEDVVLTPDPKGNGNVFLFQNARNIVLSHLTVNGVSSPKYVVYLTDTNDNIEISHCILFADTASASGRGPTVVQIENGRLGTSHNIRLKHNLIRGGDNGIALYGASDLHIDGITMIGNTVNDFIAAGVMGKGVRCDTVNNNLFMPRSTASNPQLFYLGDCAAEEVCNNRFINPYPIKSVQGLYLYHFNADSSCKGLIANNEVVINMTFDGFGINLDESCYDLVNNTSIVRGGDGKLFAFYCGNRNKGMYMNIVNNNFICYNAGFPIYYEDPSNIGSSVTADYNNCYGNKYIGYCKGEYTDLSSWQQATKDIHATNINPNFVDPSVSAKCLFYSGLDCPMFSGVSKDIDGGVRTVNTTMGCYSDVPVPFNATLNGFVDWPYACLTTSQYPAKVILMNGGSKDTLRSCTLQWTWNGVRQTDMKWTGMLPPYTMDTVLIGNFTPKEGENEILVWVTMQNGMRSDNKPSDDSIAQTAYGCVAPMSGVKTVGGASADFVTLNDAISKLNHCGMDAPVTLKLLPGTYPHVSLGGTIQGLGAKNTLTITSSTGKAEDVTIIADGSAVELKGIGYVRITNLTLDATKGGNGLVMSGSMSDVEVRHCRIMLNPAITTEQYGIYGGSDGSIRNDIRIIGNTVNGGYYGIYMYNGSGSAANQHGKGCVIDSNEVTNAYYHFIYAYYTDLTSISHNRILARKNGGYNYFNGIYTYYCNIDLVDGNFIDSYREYITNTHNPISINYSNYTYGQSSTGMTIISNNEIRAKGSNGYVYGLRSYYNKAKVINNSVYVDNPYTYGFCMYIYTVSGYVQEVMNNNLIYIGAGGSAYPFYSNSAAAAQIKLSGNNYYRQGGTNLAYFGSAQANLAAVQKTDATATNVYPEFININRDMKIRKTQSTALDCPSYSEAQADFDGNVRAKTTIRGAYNAVELRYNATFKGFASPAGATLNPGAKVPVMVNLLNKGDSTITAATIYWTVNGVSQQPYKWKGNLPGDKSEAVTLDTIVGQPKNNLIVVWVHLDDHADMLAADDTLSNNFFGCALPLSGSYTVGAGCDFTTLTDAIFALYKCGVGGPVEMRLAKGVYEDVEFEGTFPGGGSKNIVTFTSATGKRGDVMLKGKSTTTALMLVDAGYLCFNELCIGDTNTDVKTIVIKNTLTDITFRNCDLCAMPGSQNSQAYVVFSNNTATGKPFKQLRFKQCLIYGGYANIQLNYGGSSSATMFGSLEIDSCRLLNGYYYGFQCANGYYRMTVRDNYFHNAVNSGTYRALSFGNMIAYVGIDTMARNRMWLNASSSSYALYFGQRINSGVPYTQPACIFNNEIIIEGKGTSTSYGIYSSSLNMTDVRHNTIYMNTSGTRYGIFLANTNNTNWYFNSQENLICMAGTGGVAECVHHQTNGSYLNAGTTMDNNVYYNDLKVIGHGAANINAWSQLVSNDMHSKWEKPVFTDVTARNFHTAGSSVLVPSDPIVTEDMNRLFRSSITNAGCYHDYVPAKYDVQVYAVTHPVNGAVKGSKDSVLVTLRNMGAGSVSTITVQWMLNGVLQTPFKWQAGGKALAYGDVVTDVRIGGFTVPSGRYNIKAWTENPDGNSDADVTNDTAYISVISCDSALKGTYNVGGRGAHYADLNDAVNALYYCGVAGHVVFKVASGIYDAMEFSGSIPGAGANSTVTFVSAANDANTVVVGEDATVALKLQSVSFVHFEKMTFGTQRAASPENAVLFEGYIENVHFHHCNLYVSTTTSNSTYRVVNYNNSSNNVNYLKDVRFIGNRIIGGYYGFYFQYPAGSQSNCLATAAKRSSLVMDSNVIADQYYYSIYCYYYAYIPSFSYNTLTNRDGVNTHYGAYFQQVILFDSIIGNRIRINANTTSRAFYMYNTINNPANFGTGTMPALFANNDVIVTGSTVYGLYFGYNANVQIVNNSFYAKGNTNYALYNTGQTNANCSLYVKNNVIKTENGSTNNYMVYVGTAANVTTTSNPTFLDSNNYYTTGTKNTNFYCSSAKTLASWQSSHKQDLNSVTEALVFPNFPNDLSIAQYSGALKINRHHRVTRDINGTPRTRLTVMGAYSTPLFEGSDLMPDAYVEPLTGGIQCVPNSTPVKLRIYNQGTVDVDFSTTPMKVWLKCESDSVNLQTSVDVKSGLIKVMGYDTVDLLSHLDITYPGMYRLTAWIEWANDQQKFNDTLRLDYYVDKTILPYENNFTGTFAGVSVNQTYGDIMWEVTNSNPVLNPVYGTGSLLFRSSTERGSISQAVFTSMTLQNTYRPQLYFWYAHDNKNPYLMDQMDVRISQDGGATFKTLKTLYRYDAKCTQPTWKRYQIDLSNYTTGNCIVLVFTAYSYGGGDQTIDQVKIVAMQDMQVRVDAPVESDFAACNLTGRSLKVYLENLTGQEVPFKAGDSVTVEMSGASNFVLKQALSGRLESRELDSLVLSPIDYVGGGQFDVKVYVNAIDSNASNDTAKFSLNLNPDLAVTRHDAIGYTEPGDTVYVGFTMKNTGNLEIVSPFEVLVVLNMADTVRETISRVLKPGDTLYHRFSQGIIVPVTTSDQPFYLLDVYAQMPCDANGDNDSVRITGLVNVVDNGILSIISPAATPCAMGGSMAKVEVRLFNNGTVDNTDSLLLTAVIDSAGVAYATLTEKIAPMYGGENRNHTFSQSYRVPRLSVNGSQAAYKVTVFLGALADDIDHGNDTAKVEACVEGGVGIEDATIDRWTVGQNVPNPASELTRIPYVIPESGVLTLRIMGMNGQVLYREDVNAEAGSGDIRVNLSDLAAGVYYYSVEYRGERVVRKMNVVR